MQTEISNEELNKALTILNKINGKLPVRRLPFLYLHLKKTDKEIYLYKDGLL